MFNFIGSETYKERGISLVDLEYQHKLFTGKARKHPDDEWSEFFGCEIAEIRARIKAAKYELNKKKREYKCYENFVKSLECYKNFDPESPTAKVVYRQLNQRKKELYIAKSRVKTLKESIPIMIKNRELFQQKVANVKAKRESGQE